MNNNYLLDKRDNKNTLIDRKLSYDAFKLSVTDINKIKKITWFKKIPGNELFLLSINKIIYKKYYSAVTKNYLNNSDIIINDIYKTDYIKKNFIKKLLKKYILNLKNIIYYFFYNQKFLKNNITINYVSGVDNNNESDLYWLQNNNNINRNNIIIYLEKENYNNRKKNSKKELNQIKIQGFKLIDVNKIFIKNIFCKNLNDIKLILENVITNDVLQNWLKHFIQSQILEINFWYSFFKLTNTKIHLDITEAGLKNINKNIALSYLDSLSIGKERSVLNENYPQGAISYYPNDIFFTWGSRSLNNYLNSFNKHNNIIITGHPTISNKLINIKSKDVFLNNFKRKNKFKILIIDNMHSYNKSAYGQNIYTPFMEKFLKFFIDLVKYNHDYAILYKTKDKKYLREFDTINNEIQYISDSGKFILLEDSLNTQPYMFAQFCDLSVSINVHLSTSLIENAICGNKCIHFDYANNDNFEVDLYNFGKNKIIFNDFEILKRKLIHYFNNNCTDDEFGNWKNIISQFDAFCDSKGYERISKYIYYLKKSFDNNLNKENAIKFANKKYIELYGDDKIKTKFDQLELQ